MRALLVYLHTVLIGDTDLTEVIPSDNMGSSVRQNAKWPCLEYGVAEVPFQRPGKRLIVISIRIYSAVGESECWKAAEALEKIMTPKRLTDKDRGFKVDKVRISDTKGETDLFTDWRSRLEVEYSVWLSELHPVKQT